MSIAQKNLNTKTATVMGTIVRLLVKAEKRMIANVCMTIPEIYAEPEKKSLHKMNDAHGSDASFSFISNTTYYIRTGSRKATFFAIAFVLMNLGLMNRAWGQSTRYAVGNGSWNSTGTWSATSGGASGASVPVAGDIVII